MFKVEQDTENGMWVVVADYGNPFYEAGEIVSEGYASAKEAEDSAKHFERENGLSVGGTD